jgi:acetoin utilization deacetylase AcuC-like enzyme
MSLTTQDSLVYFYPEGHQAHHVPNHPERPDRVEAIRDGLEQGGFWAPFPKLAPRDVPPETLTCIHTPSYLERLQQACQAGQWYDADTYLLPGSCELALRAAGGALAVAEQVWLRQARTGFALCRPPGHHATPDRAMGFCLLNNVALACEHLIQAHGAQRLAVVDIDLHHGNGTQDIFWRRPDVFYISTHQSPLYPGTGSLRETGDGNGAGYTLNLPLPPGTGDLGFLRAIEEVVLPVIDRYQPEMILVSAGFDPHWKDPLGYLQLSAAGYGRLISRLKAWADDHCQGRIALFLEGGYNLEASAACAQAVASELLEQPWQDPLGRSPYAETDRWLKIIQEARHLWQV